MFTKVRPKQEQFLLFLVEGLSATQAYAQAYGVDRSEGTCAVNASKLLKNAKVVARRNELMAARVARQPVTVAFLTGEALATATEARSLGQASAAIAGYQLAAKLHGLLIDRQQTDLLVRKPSASPESPDDMSEEQWLGQYALTIEHQHNQSVPTDTLLTEEEPSVPEGSQ